MAILVMLNNMDQRMMEMEQSIHSICVGCEICNGPHLTNIAIWMKSGIEKPKFATHVETAMMKIGGYQRKNGCHMMNIRNKKNRSIGK